ncbi:hypothetical protein ACHAWO_002862 [Cyclotella atomus]|uniref:Cilia- and flagella-associated protein 157 n=1 Tax=Cyclotella atomus TaxID=382360 RepID=A0ABD3QIC4_9STRA
MSRFSSRHLDALSAFDNDDEFNSIQNNLTSFQAKQKLSMKSKDARYTWLQEERKLKQSELAVTKQLSNSIGNLITEYEKGNYAKTNDLLSIKDQLEKFDTVESLQLKLVNDVKEEMQSISREATEHADALCAQLMLDTKETLCVAGVKLDDQYSSIVTEANACRRKAMKLLAEESNVDNNDVMIPKQLAAAIAEARVIENKMAQLNDESCGTVEIFEHELKQKLTSLKQDASITKKSLRSQDYARSRKAVENKAMKDIVSLAKKLENREKKLLEDKQSKLKSKDLQIRMQAQRVDQEKTKLLEDEVKLAEAKNNHELRLLVKSMNQNRTLWSHQAQETKDSASITTELETEATRLSQHRSNKERTMVREMQRQSKIKSKQMSDVESAREEVERLERLSVLASSVPYYRNIINTVPDIHKTTKARTNDVYTGRDASRTDFQCGLQQLKSFTNDKVFSDPKFRLANALHEVGVANSTYARDVVRQTIPRQEERTTGIKPY